MIREKLKELGFHIDKPNADYEFTVFCHGNGILSLSRTFRDGPWRANYSKIMSDQQIIDYCKRYCK